MDAIEILGGLLGGGKSQGGSGGLGGSILTELLKGKRKPAPQVPTGRPKSTTSGSGPERSAESIDRQASELEDLLGVAKERSVGNPASRDARTSPSLNPQPPASSRQIPSPSPSPSFHDRSPRTPPSGITVDHYSPIGRREPIDQNEEALVLVRAMINAAKADGRVTAAEQQAILDRIPSPTQDTIDFLREEFSVPLDVREFAWSVPLGMEQKVYTLSLAAIDLDTNPEANYLRELAHGLRLTPEFCNQIHQQVGAPNLY